MKTLFYLLSYAVSIALTVYLSVVSEQKWRPLPFSEFYLSTSEVINIALIMSVITFIVLGVGRLLNKQQETLKAFSLDYFNFLIAYTISILYFLLASSITFNPNLFVYIGIYATVFAFILHLVFHNNKKSVLSALWPMTLSLLKRVPSIYGFVVLLLFITPLALAIGFIFSREVADVITEIRLQFNKEKETEWTLVPAFPETTFSRPMIAVFSPQEKDKLYVLERSGPLYQVDYPSGKNKKLVLDATDKVGLVDVENGAQGITLHPEFSDISSPNYRRFFLYYTSVHNNKQQNIVSAFTLMDSAQETYNSEEKLMVLNRRNDAFHNGGSIEFGPDGYLYIALGEGIFLDWKTHTSEALRAGVMRIDVDNRETSLPITAQPLHGETKGYKIPADNPFVGDETVLDEYWAMGLRNPFRVSFDPKTGVLWAGDVGSTVWEEVNIIEKGNNYLYPTIEGPKTDDFVVPEGLAGKPTHPLYTYKHSAFDRAVIGGVVYYGKELPELNGKYLFGDNFSGKLFAIPTDQDNVESADFITQASQYAQRGISSITYSPEGEIFVTLLGAKGKPTGQLMRLTRLNEETAALAQASQQEETEASPEESKSLYLEMCARCHGTSGDGKGPDSKAFNVKIADFTAPGYRNKYDDEKLANIIKKGGVPNQLSPYMPPWELVLNEQEINGLIKHIRSLEQGEAN